MCSGTSLLYKIPKIVIGENVTFLGAEDWLRSQGVELDVVQDDECCESSFLTVRSFGMKISLFRRLFRIILRAFALSPAR